ncbi:hypothetical protein LTR94_024392 [Friedmanniomyces endolithicus]|nr:hypothetical protein LTR94_024392 [Friedmanniomyces endolithicus]
MTTAAPCALLFGAVASSAAAQSNPSTVVDDVIVTGRPQALALERPAPSASRLGLTPRETPATLDVLTQERMQIEGLRTTIEAFNAAPGVNSGALPGSVGVTSMRGFTSGAIAYLFDGVRVTGSNSAIRNLDTFNFERIEVLKGPASVLYGEGALAGAINLVPKRAGIGETGGETLISLGSFGSVRLGLGGAIPLNEAMALRSDASLSDAEGWADDTSASTRAVTSSLLIRPTERLSITLYADYFEDRSSPYFGSTLVPAEAALEPSELVENSSGLVLDRSTLRTNYNVDDGVMKSQSLQLRARAAYRLSESWTLHNEWAAYDADRLWRNVEDVAYHAATGLLDRNTTLIAHDHEFWSNRAWAAFDGLLAGRRNRFTLGVEYSDTQFLTERRFGQTTAVDRLNPVRGDFPALTQDAFPGAGGRVDWVSASSTRAVFFENALNLTPKWLVVGGLRYDDIDLDRQTHDLNTGSQAAFGQTYDPVSWRLGAVYDVRPRTQVYAQFSHAVTPVSSFLFLNSANAQFDLSAGDAVEVGIKSSLWGDRADLTAAIYQIIQGDILTRDPANPALTVQGGEQKSHGVEISLSAAVTDRLRLDVSGAWLESAFETLVEAGGLAVLPITLGATVRHNGDFNTSNANDLRVKSSTITDAQISWRAPFGRMTLRGRNLFDVLYADWSGYGAAQVYIGVPRSFDIALSREF